MVRRYFNMRRRQHATRFNGLSRLSRRQTEIRSWSTGLPQDHSLFAREAMPVYDRKSAAGFQRSVRGKGQARTVENSMKGISHKDEVNGRRYQ